MCSIQRTELKIRSWELKGLSLFLFLRFSRSHVILKMTSSRSLLSKWLNWICGINHYQFLGGGGGEGGGSEDCGRVTEKSTWSPIRLCNILMTLSPTYSSTAPLYTMLVTTDPPSAPPENQVILPPTNPPAINSP